MISGGLTLYGLGVNAIFQTVAIFVFAFFWAIESDRIKRSAVSLLPLAQRDPTRELIGEIEQRVGGYVNGQLLLCVIIGALSLVAYLIIGLPYAPLLAVAIQVSVGHPVQVVRRRSSSAALPAPARRRERVLCPDPTTPERGRPPPLAQPCRPGPPRRPSAAGR